jgi:hypothetical protein
VCRDRQTSRLFVARNRMLLYTVVYTEDENTSEAEPRATIGHLPGGQSKGWEARLG